MTLTAELTLLLDLAADEEEHAFPLVTVDEYAEYRLGGWDGPGRCEFCGKDAPEVTRLAKYCELCVQTHWIEACGEFKAIITLARSLYRGLSPVFEYLKLLAELREKR